MNKIELGELKDYYYRNYDFDSLLDLLFGECDKVDKLNKEIERLNNIIDELEKYLSWVIEYTLNNDEKGTCKSILDKLKELKENNGNN